MLRYSVCFSLFLAPALITPSLSWADTTCDELWFTRNAIMDRLGYCFGSPLGKALFDNSDCTGKSVSPTAANARDIERLRDSEEEFECKVDTSRTSMAFPDLGVRRSLVDLPIPDGYESACIGWVAAKMSLHSGATSDSAVIGEIAQGDSLMFVHFAEDDWSYVTVHSADFQQFKSSGWLRPHGLEVCEAWAG